MPRHARGSSGVPALFLQQHHAPPHAAGAAAGSPHPAPGYGLIQPLPPLAIPSAPLVSHRHHKRLGSSSLTPPWADWEIDLHEWKERGLDFGKDVGGKIGGRFPGVRYSASRCPSPRRDGCYRRMPSALAPSIADATNVAFFSALHTNLALSTAIGPPSPDFPPAPPLATAPAPFALPTPPPSPSEPSSASTSATPPSAKTPSTASLSPLSTPPRRHRAVSIPTPPFTSSSPPTSTAAEPTISPATTPDSRRAVGAFLAATTAADRAAHAARRLRDPVNLALLAAFAGLCVASLAPGAPARRAGDALLGLAGAAVLLHRLRPALAVQCAPYVQLPDAMTAQLTYGLAWGFERLHRALGGLQLASDDAVLVARSGDVVVGAVVYRVRAPPSDAAKDASLHPAPRAVPRRSSSAGSASSAGTAATSASSTGSAASATISTVIQAPTAAPKGRKAKRKKSTAASASASASATAGAAEIRRAPPAVAVRAWVVAPAHRGRGLGRRLLHAALSSTVAATPGGAGTALGAAWEPLALVGGTVGMWYARVQAWRWGTHGACVAGGVPGWAVAVLERAVAGVRGEREGARGRGRGKERRGK